ncbi:MAG: NAD(P)H-quinone oxidoreductase [Candidatus Eremiobacteraeota bacterium]|nr:NAD(P)H-quinone oxidoreductase [Candidatus Eremiobacteraeota bacterium]
MKALRITRFGDPDVLRVEKVARPQPLPGQALVRVRAAGVNRADLLQRAGHYPPPSDAPPDIPGLEFCGEIVELVSAQTSLRLGDRVFGLCSGGAQAEFLAVDARLLLAVPAALDDVDAASIAEAYVTAHDALITQANVQPAERVLVHAVGSSVGIAALQIARMRGCQVFGTSRSPKKLARAKSFGLHEGFDTTGDDFAQGLAPYGGVDVIVDFVGAPYFEKNLAVLALNGRLISLATLGGGSAALSMDTLMRKRLHLIGSVLRSRSTDEKVTATRAFERDVLPAIADGSVRVPVDTVFPLEQAAAAHRYVQANENFGKVVLTV